MLVSRWFDPGAERVSHSLDLVEVLDRRDPLDGLLPAICLEPRP